MSALDFFLAIMSLSARFRFSVTSWGRSEKRNAEVDGAPDSMHLYFLAVDIVLDQDEDNIPFYDAVKRLGLVCLIEPGHLHVQIPRLKDG